MATIFNSVDCTTDLKNLGFGDCVADLKNIIGGFKVPGTFKLDAADLATKATALAALAAAAASDVKGSRIYPIHRLKNPTDNTEDTTKQSFSDGSQAVVREGLNMWGFQVTNGGLCLHKSLRTHKQNGGYFIFYDADFTIIGWKKNEGEIWGVPLNFFWPKPWKMNDGSNVTNYSFDMAFEPRYVNEAVGYARLDSTLEGIEGLQDVVLAESAFDGDTGVAEVTALTECAATNMATLYGTELAVAGAWVATNAETGAAITIDTVTVIGGSDPRFEITFDTGDGDYPTDGTILLSLAAVSVLEGLGVEGFESNELELVVGAS